MTSFQVSYFVRAQVHTVSSLCRIAACWSESFCWSIRNFEESCSYSDTEMVQERSLLVILQTEHNTRYCLAVPALTHSNPTSPHSQAITITIITIIRI